MPASTASSTTGRICVAVLIILGCFGLLKPLYSTPLKLTLGNEGWLAMTVAAWRQGLPLYPAANEFFVANYLPLAYAPYRLLERMFGDVILPGRILSWALLAALCVCVFAIVFSLLRRCWPALVAGVLTFTTFSTWYTGNLGVAEPQLIGHLLLLIAVLLLIRSIDRPIAIFTATASMILAGLVKPNLFAFPLGFAFWMWWTRSPYLFSWALGCALASAFISFGLYLCFGADLFFPNVLLGRLYSTHVLLNNLTMLSSLIVPLSVCIIFARSLLATREGILIGCLIAASFLEFTTTGTVVGSAWNVGYDLALACCIGAGVVIGRIESDFPVIRMRLHAADLILLLMVVRVGLAIAPQFAVRSLSEDTRASLLDNDREARSIVEHLAAAPGEAICTHLAYCYWAGKIYRADLSMMPLVFFNPPRSLTPLLEKIKHRSFAAIEIPRTGVLAKEFRTALSCYEPVHTADMAVTKSIILAPVSACRTDPALPSQGE
jgi:hypothetical protein